VVAKKTANNFRGLPTHLLHTELCMVSVVHVTECIATVDTFATNFAVY